MFNKNILGISLILFVLLVSIGSVFAHDNSTTDVIANNDNNQQGQIFEDDLVSEGETKDFTEIQRQVAEAENNEVIYLEGDYDDPVNSISIYNKALTFDGNNKTTLTATGSHDIFGIYSDNCTVRNLKFFDCSFSTICVRGNNFLVENCEFINNKPSIYSDGGALFIEGNNITIKNCIFKNNENPVHVSGRGVNIINSTFRDNTRAAISISGLDELIEDCEFIGNSLGISYSGYGRYYGDELVYDGSERFIVKNSKFSNHNEGALRYSFSSELQESFTANMAIIDNCSFISNSAERGAAISFDAMNGKYTYSKVSISNSKFENNKASKFNGGAISSYASCTRISRCNFTDNEAYENGGALHLNGNDCVVENSRFINSNAWYDDVYYADVGGGAIFYNGFNLSVSKSHFENSRGSKGGAILVDLDDYGSDKKSLLNVFESNFTANHAKMFGAIFGGYGVLNIDGCQFIRNTAEICSAVASGGTAKITNSKFINNTSPYAAISVGTQYALNDNVYSGNKYGLLIAGPDYRAKAYDDNLKKMELIKFTASNLKTQYGSNRHFTVKLTHIFTGAPIHDADIFVYDTKTGKRIGGGVTDAKGIFKLDTIKVGTYKIKVVLDGRGFNTWRSWLSFSHDYYPDPFTATITISKIPTKVKAAKLTAKYKKSKYFKITVKQGKKPVKNVKLKVKIGKMLFKVKTNSKGIAKINTKKLKIGKHNVKISSTDVNYEINAKSKITIKR